jgi:hypothetical protein
MARLNPYERRMQKKAEERAKQPAPPPTPRIEFVRADPQYANRVSRIRFGATALRDFPRLASRWASDYER